MRVWVRFSLVSLLVSGCSRAPDGGGRTAAARASATVENGAGRTVATARFTPAEGGVKMVVEGLDLPPGRHGIHLHEAGRCDGPSFQSAGEHLNPQNHGHGLEEPPAHLGDLPNLDVASDGRAWLEYLIAGATLERGPARESLLRDGGTTLVIHEHEDDQKSDPAGNSGDRIACGVIQADG